MSPPSEEQLQNLVHERNRLYGEAFNRVDADAVSSWHSKDMVFNDIAMDEILMTKSVSLSMFRKSFAGISRMEILEDRTTASDPYFSAWEMLIELESSLDDPALGLVKGTKSHVRGTSLLWWRWEGKEEEEYFGNDVEKIKGWKIVREHDYMCVLKAGSEQVAERLFDGPGGLKGV